MREIEWVVEAPSLPLRWSSLASWHPAFTSFIHQLLGPTALDRLRALDAQHLLDDDPEWFDLVVNEFDGTEEELVGLFSARLQQRKIRTFHGTRVADASTFHEVGIRLHDRVKLEAEVRELIERHEGLSWLQPTLDERFSDTARLIDEGRCFVVVDERVLVEECGHYLLGGSEFIQGIISAKVAQMVLRDCAPTVVEIDLPLDKVRPSQMTELVKDLIGEWARVHRHSEEQARRLDFTFCLRDHVPPEWVVGHYHPPVIKDPHLFRRAVQIEKPFCPACAK